MIHCHKIAALYLQYLEASDLTKLLSLFSDKAIVKSPLYGKMNAVDFYKTLFKDTITSRLSMDGIFVEEGSNRFTLVFDYCWKMKNNEEVKFKVVDIIALDNFSKIKELHIIYDTVESRRAFTKSSES